MLDVDGLSMHFGGVKALTDVTFSVGPTELVAIIGPNGAGKTSLFNCLNGVYKPTAGSIRFGGQELVGKRPSRIAELGMARTFQNLALFTNLDVVANLMLGRHHLMRSGFFSGAMWFGRSRREEHLHRERCEEIVDFLDLGAYRGRPVGVLPYGIQKRIELGRGLAMEPQLLLLDEPAAGMNPEETDQLADTILAVQADLSIAMLLVEHDMHLVMDIADRVVALNFGEVMAIGRPDDVAADETVIAAYLGAEE
ncbi:MAG: ABC transporter ATP-binding protein [Acidimicrobiales bacterium]|nr:ABC transporter ATP-binding protein [Acidimicrobiales bacterium]